MKAAKVLAWQTAADMHAQRPALEAQLQDAIAERQARALEVTEQEQRDTEQGDARNRTNDNDGPTFYLTP